MHGFANLCMSVEKSWPWY